MSKASSVDTVKKLIIPNLTIRDKIGTLSYLIMEMVLLYQPKNLYNVYKLELCVTWMPI